MNEFVSLTDLLTNPAVAIAVTTVVAAGLNYAFGVRPQWLALAVAMALMVGGYLVQVAQYDNMVLNWAQLFMQVVYGFAVFFSAAGLSAAGATVQQRRALTRNATVPERGLTHWF